eukprot:23074-Alexandrium_andersonii.AAC.1
MLAADSVGVRALTVCSTRKDFVTAATCWRLGTRSQSQAAKQGPRRAGTFFQLRSCPENSSKRRVSRMRPTNGQKST